MLATMSALNSENSLFNNRLITVNSLFNNHPAEDLILNRNNYLQIFRGGLENKAILASS